MGWGFTSDWFQNPLASTLGSIGSGFQQTNTPTSLLTPEQQQYYTQLLQGIQGVQQTPYQVSEFNYNPSWQGQSNEAMASMLSGKPAYEINPEVTEQYYQESIYNPAVKQYEETTRPAWMEKTSNIHSSARDIQEQQGYENLYGGLQAQHGQLVYADEQARRQALESAAARQGQGIGLGQQAQNLAQQQWGTENQLGLASNAQNYQQIMSQYQMMLQALGLPAIENIMHQPGTIEGLMGGLGNLFS